MSKVIVIGKGPAGVSCAIYTVRAGIETVIIGSGTGALGKAEKIENYYGLSAPISGAELSETGIEQARRLGAEIISEEVVGMGYDGGFSVKTQGGEYRAESVVIATGSPRKAPGIKGIEEFEGRGVSYCALCDAFFYRGKTVCVLGSGEYAINEARELMPIVGKVTILTNGDELAGEPPEGSEVVKTPLSELKGGERLESVSFKDGSEIATDGLFVAYGTAGSADLARKLGVFTEGNKISVNEDMETNIPGLFAAGDCTGGMLQVAKAVYDGAKAGMSAVKYLRGGK
ncbi:MAG: NAD(P)/FAD-dependent oxidoreductase [Clostridiales bacterium]|nr:NAD(P)/FAD-dependent oxidoreductase [Clostridiales bacterium]